MVTAFDSFLEEAATNGRELYIGFESYYHFQDPKAITHLAQTYIAHPTEGLPIQDRATSVCGLPLQKTMIIVRVEAGHRNICPTCFPS